MTQMVRECKYRVSLPTLPDPPAFHCPAILMKPHKEKDKPEYRMVLNLKNLNKLVLPRSNFPLPPAADIIAKLSFKKLFITLDHTLGFYQLVLDERSSKLCSFHTSEAQYLLCRLPMGSSMSVHAYCSTMAKCYEGILHRTIWGYVDDFWTASNTFEELVLGVPNCGNQVYTDLLITGNS
ncbi:uncharacterized protein LOC127749188 [Frankliniella occidentalis]|uniref:Uncharacterized protein LOC127749188 n=1 Tax=Frankliniella occidentalis TaxID=133901 RepID=A0A9C6U703_FRAOC|nr:uncharacterized protein LOC127749188 [Frankliniella occidentalis]